MTFSKNPITCMIEISYKQFFFIIHTFVDDGCHNNTRVGFHVGLSRHLSLSPSQIVIFNKIITNKGNAYNLTNGHVTAPCDGMYSFTASFLSDSKILQLDMLRNAERISAAYAESGGSCSMTAVVMLTKGDTVMIRHLPFGVIGRIEAELSYFSGYLIN